MGDVAAELLDDQFEAIVGHRVHAVHAMVNEWWRDEVIAKPRREWSDPRLYGVPNFRLPLMTGVSRLVRACVEHVGLSHAWDSDVVFDVVAARVLSLAGRSAWFEGECYAWGVLRADGHVQNDAVREPDPGPWLRVIEELSRGEEAGAGQVVDLQAAEPVGDVTDVRGDAGGAARGAVG
ncbi:MAG: hypothetical protein AAFR96_13405 [Planctomycetota bacterium]